MNNMVFVIHNIETGKEHDLTTQIMPGSALGRFVIQWSPDSRYLIMNARRREHDQDGIYKVDIKTGEQTPLLLSEKPRSFFYSKIAPDGTSLFYLNSSESALMKYDLETKQKREVYKSSEEIGHTSLSPDGKYLAFRYVYDKPNDLWIISTSGGDPKKVGTLPIDQSIQWPVWTPDSRSVILTVSKSRKVYRFPIDGSKPSILEISMKNARHLEIHPDGTTIVYDKKIPGGNKIWAIENFLPKKE
jgi:Tol biopolymer transport system component